MLEKLAHRREDHRRVPVSESRLPYGMGPPLLSHHYMAIRNDVREHEQVRSIMLLDRETQISVPMYTETSEHVTRRHRFGEPSNSRRTIAQQPVMEIEPIPQRA